MVTGKRSIEDAPLGAFHHRLALYSSGGPFCDGYILGIIAVALVPLSKDIGLTPTWQGLIAAAALAGMFVGGSLFGYLTDLLGRQKMYTLDLAVLVAASAAQFWVHEGRSLLALRFLLGIAIGADYPIAAALLSEFSPKRNRGSLLSLMIAAWWLGYTFSFVAGYALSHVGGSAWRWMLASSALPAAVVVLLRRNTPESPRWLVSKGRTREAQELIERHFGHDYALDNLRPVKTSYRDIFRAPYALRTLFVCLFWSCQVIPTFAIYTYAPALLRELGSANPTLGAAVMSLFFLGGVVAAIFLVDHIGRRPLIIVSFAVTAVTLVALSVIPPGAASLITLGFGVFAIFNAGSSVLQWIYPSELFATEVRATALGFATAISRVGAAIGTFLLPISLLRLGVGPTMLVVAGICALGWTISVAWAPETRGVSLKETTD